MHSSRPRHALLLGFDALERATLHGLELDEPCYRALLICCGYCGPAFAADAQRIYGIMKANGINPNAVTYGHYSAAVTGHDDFRSDTRKAMALKRWAKLRVVKDVIIALGRLRRFVSDCFAYNLHWHCDFMCCVMLM
jgi:hypothetical protein